MPPDRQNPALPAPRPLSPEQLCRRCDPARFPFDTTETLEGLTSALGQERATEAVRFGTGIRRDGYNLFAMGPPETGRHTWVRSLLEERAGREAVPPDVCYVHDFAVPHRPRALRLPPGKGQELKKDVEALVEDLRTVIPAALESDEHRARRRTLEQETKETHEKDLTALREAAEAKGIGVIRTPLGFAFAPVRDGKVLTPDEFEALPEEERKRVEADIEGLQEILRGILLKAPKWEKDLRERARALVRETTIAAVGHAIDELRRKWAPHPEVVKHLDDLQQDVLENVGDFLRTGEGGAPSGPLPPEAGEAGEPGPFRRYRVNVLVDHGASKGAPVVYEDHPTYPNLVGRVEHIAQMGALVTDFNLVKAGALHRANGGYLVLDARELLLQPYAWDGLKRALKSREVRIESLGQMLSLVSTVSLEPEPTPLAVKVVLVGERLLCALLDRYDPDFAALFKVAVDFEEDLDRGDENDLLYARLVAGVAKREGLRPLDRTAVAAVLDRSARLAGDSGKLSARVGVLADLLRQADWWAGDAGRAVVTDGDVRRAVAAQERREGRLRERVLEEIGKGTFRIDTSGALVGQVNGLSVMDGGRLAFGRPARITAKVRLGKGEVVDIEREVELGGPIHSKGVMILAAFLGARYAREHPLSLSATIVFEQSYGMIEGDSASSTELYALLSALSDVPLSQSLAVTGSVDQHGLVQAVGGVNEKIEGFFDVCRAKGLTGEHGVLLPATNVRHLMLRNDVVDAVRSGKFRIWPVETIDQGLELLTGRPAGERGGDGRFPKGSVNAAVEARLVALAERRRELGVPMGPTGPMGPMGPKIEGDAP